jgi:hypothetical protein
MVKDNVQVLAIRQFNVCNKRMEVSPAVGVVNGPVYGNLDPNGFGPWQEITLNGSPYPTFDINERTICYSWPVYLKINCLYSPLVSLTSTQTVRMRAVLWTENEGTTQNSIFSWYINHNWATWNTSNSGIDGTYMNMQANQGI